MLKLAALFFTSWYFLTLLFPNIPGGTKRSTSLPPRPPHEGERVIFASPDVKYMASIIKTKINPSTNDHDAHNIATAVMEAGCNYKLNPFLILGVIYAESNARPYAFNGGSFGLMQVMPKWWDSTLRKRGIIKEQEDYFNIRPAVMAGSFILQRCMNRAGWDIRKALNYYTGKAPNSYVKKVLSIVALGEHRNGGM